MGLLRALHAPLLTVAVTTAVLAGCGSGSDAPAADGPAEIGPAEVEAPEVEALEVAPEHADQDYDRDAFGDWETQPDGCTTRERVLLDEATEAPDVGPGCDVGDGEWESVYDGEVVDDPGELDIDHLVPLAEAWESGADEWTDAEREAYANDLEHPQALVAVTAGSNRSKGDGDPAEWRPPERSTWCDYALDWIAVKAEWGLTADPDEIAELEEMLATC